MSVTINFENIVKKYGDNVIIPDLSCTVKKGEFFTLLGPSGCGKTTLLRMVAGFNTIEGGTISFNDKSINALDPAKRNIGMVFQNYAIFPHMSVRKNVEFGLTNRKVEKEQVKTLAAQMLETVKMMQYADRMPDKLSGGQQQRVALARAIVIQPDVLLMDEPLSNLDAKLRVEMRSAIKEIQNKIQITTIYVTHDQEEAMAVSDRIAVMKDGFIQHIGTPQNIYQRPANLFVATFIGHSNVLKGVIKKENGAYTLSVGENYKETLGALSTSVTSAEQNVKVSIRPEEFIICEDENAMHGTITSSVFLGVNTHYFITLESGENVEIIQESNVGSILPHGEKICLKAKIARINIFDEQDESNLMSGVINDA